MEILAVTVKARRRPRWKRREKVDLRTIGKAVAVLQMAEGMAIHAERDGCILHGIIALGARADCLRAIPSRYRDDPEWMYRHVEALGARIQARREWAE